MMHTMTRTEISPANWDDLRFVVAVARHGSLLRAAKELAVDHTTVGRRIAAAERTLGATLFTRGPGGLVLTAEGDGLLAPLQAVEDAVSALLRRATSEQGELVGNVKVTSPESFGIAWLAPRLATFARQHPGLRVTLDPSGKVLDLARREAEVAVRFFRSKDKDLVARRVADVGHGLYAARSYLARYPVRGARDLVGRPLLSGPPGDVDSDWLQHISGDTPPIFTSVLSVALAGAARAGAGIAVLPRYLGDAEPELEHLPMPDEPKESLWLTVHRDLRATPRVRAVLDFLVATFQRERSALGGR